MYGSEARHELFSHLHLHTAADSATSNLAHSMVQPGGPQSSLQANSPPRPHAQASGLVVVVDTFCCYDDDGNNNNNETKSLIKSNLGGKDLSHLTPHLIVHH